MHRWFSAFLALAAAFALSGCFSADYDIAAQLKPETPLVAGRYKSDDNKPVNLSLAGSVYTAVAENDPKDEPSHLQFFRVPESDAAYIVKVWTDPTDKSRSTYVYVFGTVSRGGAAFLDARYDELPPALQNLVELMGGDLIIRDGPRDTLYLLREIIRRGIKLERANGLTPVKP